MVLLQCCIISKQSYAQRNLIYLGDGTQNIFLIITRRTIPSLQRQRQHDTKYCSLLNHHSSIPRIIPSNLRPCSTSSAMAILDILDKPMFHSRFKLPLHILTGILVVIVIGLSVPRLFMKNQPRTRAGTIALGMVRAPHQSLRTRPDQYTNAYQGAKSLVLLTYMLAAEHVQKFKKWHSYKANVIISCLEIVFWGAVAFLVFQGNISRCEGVICYLSWVVVGIAVVIKFASLLTSAHKPLLILPTVISKSTLQLSLSVNSANIVECAIVFLFRLW